VATKTSRDRLIDAGLLLLAAAMTAGLFLVAAW